MGSKSEVISRLFGSRMVIGNCAERDFVVKDRCKDIFKKYRTPKNLPSSQSASSENINHESHVHSPVLTVARPQGKSNIQVLLSLDKGAIPLQPSSQIVQAFAFRSHCTAGWREILFIFVQDKLTTVLSSIFEACDQSRLAVRVALSAVGRGGEGDVGQRIRDEVLIFKCPTNL